MANYNSNLKTWGSQGTIYPDGYNYLEGEQPVDGWDNFIQYNTIKDIQALVSLTNDRVESDKGVAHPSSPDNAHLSYRTDDERLYHYDSTLSSWHGLLKVDGDTLQGALDLGGHELSGISKLTLAGNVDIAGNDLNDSTNGVNLYDSTNAYIPLGALEQDDVSINLGSHLSGGGAMTLGGSVSIDIDDDFLLNTGDTLTGELEGSRSSGSRVFTAASSNNNDKLSIRVSGSDTFQLVGYDSSAGAWNYNSALTYDPSSSKWTFGSLPLVNGNNMATETWVNNNSDVPNADYADQAGNTEKVNGNIIDSDKDGKVDNADKVDGFEGATLDKYTPGFDVSGHSLESGNSHPIARFPSMSDVQIDIDSYTLVNENFNSPNGLSLIIYDHTNNSELARYTASSNQNMSTNIDVSGLDVCIYLDNGDSTFGYSGTGNVERVTTTLNGEFK